MRKIYCTQAGGWVGHVRITFSASGNKMSWKKLFSVLWEKSKKPGNTLGIYRPDESPRSTYI